MLLCCSLIHQASKNSSSNLQGQLSILSTQRLDSLTWYYIAIGWEECRHECVALNQITFNFWDCYHCPFLRHHHHHRWMSPTIKMSPEQSLRLFPLNKFSREGLSTFADGLVSVRRRDWRGGGGERVACCWTRPPPWRVSKLLLAIYSLHSKSQSV
jgi:hypothetical protein